MAEGPDSHDGQPSTNAAGSGSDRTAAAAQTDSIRRDVAGIDPFRFGVLGATTFGVLAAGWLLSTYVYAGFSGPVVLADGPIGMTLREPDDLYLAASSTYALLVQIGPLLGLLLGLIVGWSVDTRTPAGVAGGAAVSVGAALTLFVLALFHVLLHPRSGSIDVLSLLEPAFASVLGTAVTCIGGAGTIGVFESLEAAE